MKCSAIVPQPKPKFVLLCPDVRKVKEKRIFFDPGSHFNLKNENYEKKIVEKKM